jgi:hypothetical protein
MDAYAKPNRALRDTSDKFSKRLKSYGVTQFYLGFYAPLFTHEEKDSSVITNGHLLLTGNFLSLKPKFDGLSKVHNLIRAGVGFRYIYNTGRKGVWFFDISPFITQDVTYRSKPFFRMGSTIVYSHNASEKFNWRVGITKSFLWGNRFYLPFLGIRIGRLDRTNFSLQFPRLLNLCIPVNEKISFNVFSRAQGGLFIFSNYDSLYFRKGESTFHFSRYEVVTGLRINANPGKKLSFYLSTGISSRNNITLYSENANRSRKNTSYNAYFLTRNFAPGVYAEAGLVLRIGKTRSAYSNKNVYDAIDLNNQAEGILYNTQIPPKVITRSQLNLETVQDLVDYNDY